MAVRKDNDPKLSVLRMKPLDLGKLRDRDAPALKSTSFGGGQVISKAARNQQKARTNKKK
jgi:hypothetical protein